MNKNDLIDALAPRLGGRPAAALAVESLVDVVLRQVAGGGSVGITGFGTFEPVERAPRTGRNPHTGQAVPIPATRTPRFRPGSYFKAVVADPDELPVDGLAGARVGSSEDGASRTGSGGDPGRPARGGTAGSTAPGAPATIRRSAETPTVAQGGARRSAGGQENAPAARRRTGTPTTVRADRAASTSAPGVETARDAGSGDRLTIGGEQITREMITAKKAQLARAKGDQVAAEDDAGQRDRGADGARAKDKKGKKAKKGKKDRAKATKGRGKDGAKGTGTRSGRS